MERDPTMCRSFVEMVTDYLEDDLPSDLRELFEGHMGECSGCERYVEQMKTTIRVLAKSIEDQVDPTVRSEVLEKLPLNRD